MAYGVRGVFELADVGCFPPPAEVGAGCRLEDRRACGCQSRRKRNVKMRWASSPAAGTGGGPLRLLLTENFCRSVWRRGGLPQRPEASE